MNQYTFVSAIVQTHFVRDHKIRIEIAIRNSVFLNEKKLDFQICKEHTYYIDQWLCLIFQFEFLLFKSSDFSLNS